MLGGANGATGMAFGLICLLGTVIGADSIGTGGSDAGADIGGNPGNPGGGACPHTRCITRGRG